MKGSNYYDGNFQDTDDAQRFQVKNPFDGTVVGTAVMSDYASIEKALESADNGFKRWSIFSGKERGALLYKLYQKVIENSEALAEIMTLEQGKPLKEAQVEVHYGASFIKWYAEEATRIYGDILEANHKNQRIMVLKEPVGPVGIITPWNFPLAMITRKLAPAIAAGCSVLVKPAEETPLTAYVLFQLIHSVGFPPGVLNLITGDPVMIGKAMMAHFGLRKVSFTGSTEVGQILVTQSSQTMKKLSLELGGHAPLIVFDDADIKKAVQGTLDSKFRNCGQVCIATNRVFVQRKIYPEYIVALKNAVEKLQVGSGLLDVDLGPVINRSGYEKIEAHVKDALDKGGELIMGGSGQALGEDYGFFYQPTLISQVNSNMRLMQEETFGPVVPITLFDTEEEVISLANHSPFGLASYFFTESLSRSHRVQEALEYGMVGVNTGKISAEQVPFGGVKMSGYGREGGYYGLEEFLHTKYVCIGL